MPARRDGPFIDFDLMPANARGAPFRIRSQTRHGAHVVIEHVPVDGHRVLHPHDKLHIELFRQPPVAMHGDGLVDMAEIEGLDLGRHVISAHLTGQPIDQIGRVLVNAGGKVVRPHGQRGHVGAERQHGPALRARPRSAAGRELDDHAGAVFLQPLHKPPEFLGVAGGGLIVVAHMGMGDRGPGLERGLRAFDLFGDGDRQRRVRRLGRHGSGDCHADDAGFGHGGASRYRRIPFHPAPARGCQTDRRPGRRVLRAGRSMCHGGVPIQ